MNILPLLFLLILSFLGMSGARLIKYEISGLAQGTTYHITYYDDKESIKKHSVDSLLIMIDNSLSIYKSNSLISRFNESDSGIKVDRLLKTVVKKSLKVYCETNGMFDITVLPLVEAWGFGPTRISGLPDSAQVDSLLNYVGSEKIKLRGNYLGKRKEGIKIDVNGIGQGYSVDILADYFEKKGVKKYLIELGGEIRVKGKKPNGDKMAIGIEGPGENDRFPIQKIVRVDKGAITTSGNYRKFYQEGSRKLTHLINPKTGYPLNNGMISVTLYGKDAITADAYDNALMAMSVREALEVVEKSGELEGYFIYRREDGSIADTATRGFYQLLQ